MNPSIGVVIIARDEEKNIGVVLDSLFNQTISPTHVILVNDNSKDNTRNIAERYNVDIVDFPYNHENWVISGELSKVFNIGFEKISKDLDYYMILGGDTVLSKDYIEIVIDTMKSNDYHLCSGIIDGESFSLRGSGRIMTKHLMESQDFSYKVNYGYETYMIFRAMCDGLKVGVEKNATSKTIRKTGTFYDSKKTFHRGCAYRCLGYSFPFITALAFMRYYNKPKFLISFLKGWFICPKSAFYESDLRKFTKSYEKTKIREKLGNVF